MKLLLVSSVLAASFATFSATKAETQTAIHTEPSQPTPEQIAKLPVVALPVGSFKLMAPNTGWVSAGGKILWTTDNGEHWKDISPPGSNRGPILNALFHDEETGWVL